LQGVFLTDQEMWDRAVTLARVEYQALSESVKAQLQTIGAAMRQHKREMYSLAGGSAVVATCADCGGLCCEKGKYHFFRHRPADVSLNRQRAVHAVFPRNALSISGERGLSHGPGIPSLYLYNLSLRAT
jgi:hypothetical protein